MAGLFASEVRCGPTDVSNPIFPFRDEVAKGPLILTVVPFNYVLSVMTYMGVHVRATASAMAFSSER